MAFLLHRKHRQKVALCAALIAGAFLLLGVFVWLFSLTGNFLLTKAVPPLFTRITGVNVHASEVALSWDGTLKIRNFQLGSLEDPLLKVPEFSAEISLWEFLVQKSLQVEEIRIADAEILLLRRSDGSANWSGIAARTSSDASAPQQKGSAELRLLLKNLILENAAVIWRDCRSDLDREIRWSNINASLSDFGNCSRTEAELSGDLHFSSSRNMSAKARLSLHGMIRLDEDLGLQELSFASALSQGSGNIGQRIIKPGRVDLRCHLLREENRWDLRQLRLRQIRQDVQQSILDLSGEISPEPLHYQMELRQAQLSGELLPFFCDFFFGVNPGDLSFTGSGTLAGGDSALTLRGSWDMSREEGDAFFGEKHIALPEFQLNVQQDIALNWRERIFSLRQLQVKLQSAGAVMAELDLQHPLSYDLAQNDPSQIVPDLRVYFSEFRLALLHFLLPAQQDLQLDGRISGEIVARPDQTADKVHLTGNLRGKDLFLRCAGWNLSDTDGVWDGSFALDRKRDLLDCPAMTVQLSQGETPLIRGICSGKWDLAAQEADAAVKLDRANEHLLQSFPTEIGGFIRKMPFVPKCFQLSAAGELHFAKDLFRLRNCRVTAAGENNAQFTVSLDQQNFQNGTARDLWKFRLAAGAPVHLLTPFLPPGIRLHNGNATLDARADAAADFQTLTLETDLHLQDSAGSFWGNDFSNGDLQFHTNLYMPSPGRILINNSDLYFLHHGRPALRAGLTGSTRYDGTAMQLTFDLRYLNEQFLNLLCADRFRTGLLTGKIAASGDLRGKLRATGILMLDKLATHSATAPSSGFLRFEAVQNPAGIQLDPMEFLLMQNGKQLAKATLRAHYPTAPEAAAQVDLTVDHADLSTLYNGVADAVPPTSAAETPMPPQKRTPFSFSTRPVYTKLRLKNLHWGESARFDLAGDLHFRESQLQTSDAVLLINGKPVRFSLDLNDTAHGMMLHSSGNVPEPLDLGAMTSIWMPDQLRGNLLRGSWDLAWNDFLAPGGDPEAQGHLEADFQDLCVQTVENNALLRIFLLPVEALVRIRGVLPSSLDLREHWKSILQSTVDPDSPLAELNFHRGKVHLELHGRDIRIRQAKFHGPTINDLAFSGGIGLAAPFALNLKTAIRTGVLRGDLPIRGTWTEPDAEIAELLTSLTGLSIDNFPDFSPQSWQTLPEKATSTFTRFLRDLIGFPTNQP